MLDFVFHNKTEIYFGRNAEERIGSLSQRLGKKVLLHYGGGSIKKTGFFHIIKDKLREAGVDFVELGGVKPNPSVSLVREGIELCRKEGITGILAVGGGSVIDSAKGISAGRFYENDVWDLYEGNGTVGDLMPVGVILTIPAAGSESSLGSVLTNEEGWLKRDIGHPRMRPLFAIMNPERTYTLPPYQTACGATDILAHVMERYFTKTRHVELTDRISEGIMKTIIHNAPKALKDPYNYDIRAEIMWSGTLAHNDLIGTGRQPDWATHNIEHEISGIYDIAHGAGLAIVFPAWMKYVMEEDVARMAQFANRVFDIEINPYDLKETALEGISALEKFYQRIGMPIRLSDADIDHTRIEEMAKKATHDDRRTLGNFKELNSQDVAAILRLAI